MKPIVYVAALTYKRPDDVADLLRGLGALGSPSAWDVRFLIVDNDPEGSARATVESAMPGLDGRLSYVVELEPGIPAARNRALREAIAGGGTLLAFLDDDETPAHDWLIRLIAHRQATGAALIGGPLRRTLPREPLTTGRHLFAYSLIARRRLAERHAARIATAGKPVPVNTSNWLCDLDIVRAGLWFDADMKVSGGSDAAFYLAARARGIATSWCADAIVSEPITPDRLRVGYQFGRSRAQGIVMAGLTDPSVARVVTTQLPRAAAGLVLMAVPVFGIASFAVGLHLLGWAIGQFAHLRGRRSALYARREAAA